MIVREISVERFIFTCTGCKYSWVADYDVRHVEDGHGHEHDYFFRDGSPSLDPTVRGVVVCPSCGWLNVKAILSGILTHFP
jgi:hypothetical protein